MNKIFALIFFCHSLFADQDLIKNQIYYFMQSKQTVKAIDIYQQQLQEGAHNFEILQHMALILLEEGMYSREAEKQLISLYGIGISSYNPPLHLLEMGMTSKNPYVQAATIHMLGRLGEDKSEEILKIGLGSPYYLIQMETAHELAQKKFPSATALIESLMYRVPRQLKVYFPEFFSMIGTPEALTRLSNLINDPDLSVRLSSFLCAARYRRDELLSYVRYAATHLNYVEQEVCARALGLFGDIHSVEQLKKLASSANKEVRLSASFSLVNLGIEEYGQIIIDEANQKNLYAIFLLPDLAHGREVLQKLLQDNDLSVRINAAIALLQLQDASCAETLMELLVRDGRDLAIIPSFSAGRALQCFKIISSAQQIAEKTKSDLLGISLSIKEMLLAKSLNLDSSTFVRIAQTLFAARQYPLIPLLVHLLENLQTDPAVNLLKTNAEMIGAPLIRGYCQLALYRLGKESIKEQFFSWIHVEKKERLIQFREILPWTSRENGIAFELTPEEKSRLLAESFEAIADRHEPQSIDIILDAIKSGNEWNRYALAGLLLRCLQ